MKFTLATLMLLTGTSATEKTAAPDAATKTAAANSPIVAEDKNTTDMANKTTPADAQELYTQALINLHQVLPTNEEIEDAINWKEKYLGFAALLKNQYQSYIGMSGANLTNMDSETFDAFVKLQEEIYNNQSLAVNGTEAPPAPQVDNDDEGFSSLDDTEATQEETQQDQNTNAQNTDGDFSPLEDLTLMVDEDHIITEAELLALQHLKTAGEAFDMLPPISMYTLSNGLYMEYNSWFPYGMEAGSNPDRYKNQAVRNIERATNTEVLSNYTTTKAAVTDAKKALYDFIEQTPPILALVNHDNWQDHYFAALCKKGEMPTLDDINAACTATNETIVCEAATTLADLTEAQRTEFNTKFNATLDTFEPFVIAGHFMDASMNETIDGVMADASQRSRNPIARYIGELQLPIFHRASLLAVYDAYKNLQTLSVVVDTVTHKQNQKESTLDKLKDKAKAALEKIKANPWPFAIGLAAIVIALGGCIYCKCAKKCCFAENKEENEGGSSDRQVFKKQVKSKNSHKRHAKENLVPTFQVADEQA